jgi:adenosylcobinamide-phosphate synthase
MTFAAAYALDVAAGDPQWFPHPVRAIGKLISWGEAISKPGTHARADFIKGAFLSCIAVSSAWLLTSAVCSQRIGKMLAMPLAWTTLATGSLVAETTSVVLALERGELERARLFLSRIVGRDTACLDESEIARAVIETAAESLCDGIIAPICYLAIGGVPLAFAYKAVNTLDSMIGHPEPPYTYFGRFAAQLDDLMNFIPARCAALAIVASSALSGDSPKNALETWCRDGWKHASPNAGQTEAAMAGALGVMLGGVNFYDGNPCPKPTFGADFRRPSTTDARRAIRIARKASFIAFAAALVWSALRK